MKYYSGDQIKKNEMGGTCGIYWGEGRCIQGFGGKPEGERPLVRSRHRWEDNIEMDLQEVGWGGMDWVGLVQDRDRWWAVVKVVMNLWFP